MLLQPHFNLLLHLIHLVFLCLLFTIKGALELLWTAFQSFDLVEQICGEFPHLSVEVLDLLVGA